MVIYLATQQAEASYDYTQLICLKNLHAIGHYTAAGWVFSLKSQCCRDMEPKQPLH